MPGKINPYIAGAPVLESRMFFGREDVFSWIERSLSGKFVDHILVLHGQRRVGKTSVLKHLGNRLPKRYIPIFIDLQGRVSTTLPRFLWWLSREITRALDLPKPDRELFEEDPDYFETQFLPQVEEKLGSDVLLFTFDEFDTLETTSAQEGLALPFMAILKRLMDHRKLNFIFSIGSSGRKLENMQAAYTGFFKQALYRKISFLSESDARDLVTKPVEGILQFKLDAVDRIYEITSGHPYFIQLICHELFSVCQKSDNWQVSKSGVEDILDAVIERGTVNLKFVWDEASELEKWVLASLAQFDSGADLGTLGKFLKDHKVRFIHQDLESAVLRLREKDVLASGNRFVIFLMKLWLIQNRSIEQVREELTAINPIVSRLLQVGHEYLDQGELDKAVDSFEEALGAEEDNLEVRMGLAAAHMAREDYGRAGAEYEEVLALYPEDVAAQSGYCDAYLALGSVRFAMGRLDEAEYAYQQVLKISPKHSDGRARMARLYHHRAVAAISGGEDVALDQARKALEFTPRDPGLQASVRELEALAAGKLEIMGVLFAWGQRAKENEHWGDAADLLSAYQRLKGGDETILSLLADIREKAHAEQLSSLRAQAERMERLGEYDEAIFALNKYLSLEPEDADQIPERIKNLKTARKQAQLREGRADAKPFWKRPLVWFSFAAVAVFSLLLFIPNSPFRAALAPEQEIVERIVVATAVPTTMPTPTPEPLPYQWSRINSAQFLERDQITDLAIHPTDRDVLYASMRTSGIYKTINGGTSWQPAFEGIKNTQVLSLAIDPQDPDILYAGTSLGGVYKTEDGGHTWYSAFKELQQYGSWEGISEVLMDSNDDSHLYYANGFNLYETLNAGETWSLLGGRQTGSCPSDSIDILLDPSNGYLYTTVYEFNTYDGCDAGVYRSKDGGEKWDLLFEAQIDFNGLFMNPDHGEKIYAMAHGDQQTLYGSSNSGETWEEYCKGCTPLGVDENGEIIIHSRGKLLRSINGTSQWETFMQLPENFSGQGIIVFNPHEPDSWYFGSNGLKIAHNGGKTTSEISSGLGATAFNIYIDKKDNAVMYAHDRGSVYRSLDGGSSMENLNIYSEGGFNQGGYFLNNEDTGGITTISGAGDSLKVSSFGDDLEETYTLNPPEGDKSCGIVCSIHPANPDLLCLVYQGHPAQIFLSPDKGITWQESINDTQIFLPVFHFSKINADRIYIVANTNVIFSQDGGKYWEDCAPEFTNQSFFWYSDSPTNAAVHPENEDWLMVATLGNGVYILEDNCKAAKISNQGLKSLFVYSLVIDPNDPKIIYAGTGGGAFISLNGGEEWREINDGLLGANLVFSLAMDSQSNVYASTPYGIFKLEDK